MQLAQLHSVGGSGGRVPPASPNLLRPQDGEAILESRLNGKRILVVEDEFLLADEIADWLGLRGVEIVGPAATLLQAQRLIEQDSDIDGAVLDINLSGTVVFPLALELRHRGVPLVFASAYSEDVVFPQELKNERRLSKPFSEAQLIRAVERALAAGG